MKKYTAGIILGLIVLLMQCSSPQGIVIVVKNPLSVLRNAETISLSKEMIKSHFPQNEFNSFVIVDSGSKDKLTTQMIDLDQDDQFEEVLFQSDFGPNEKKVFILVPSNKSYKETQAIAYAAYVPNGMQDFCWENDLIGYRFYGLEREQEQNTSSGIDIWCKRVPDNMTEKWYAEDYNYHEDLGEGADHYKVGKKRGCGGSGLIYNNTIHFANSFTQWKIIAKGPIRTIFEVEFFNWGSDLGIKETKRISLDAGQYLNKVEVQYSEMDKKGSHAVGITLRDKIDIISDTEKGMIATWEFLGENKGFLGCGMMVPQLNQVKTIDDEIFSIIDIKANQTIEYYVGGAWSEYGEIQSFEDWQFYINQQFELKQHPCKIYLNN